VIVKSDFDPSILANCKFYIGITHEREFFMPATEISSVKLLGIFSGPIVRLAELKDQLQVLPNQKSRSRSAKQNNSVLGLVYFSSVNSNG
jgi:hypothetical protein